jgi:hypothetical protein
MAYIGAVAPGYDPTRASVPQLDAERFSGDATTTAFTLTRQVVSPTDIDVIVENVTQEPTVAYSVNGYTLTFTGAPGSGTNNIYVIYRASAVSNYAFVPDGSITYAKLANNIRQFTVDTFTANGTGSTVALTEAPASANSLIVSVDGVIQTAPTNYTLSGSTITFTGVPDSGANVVIKHIGFRTTSTVTALQASSVTATEIADGAITNAKIVSVANTKITGNIVSSQITSVANTQITGNITSSQITSVANTQITGDPLFSAGSNTAPSITTSGDTDTGIYFPSANTIAFTRGGIEVGRFDSTANGNFQFNSGYGSVATAYGCRAWVNFNGTGTVAIRASGNVSSITDNGTGDYTVNFTTAIVDVNYSTVGLCGGTGDVFSAIGSTYTTSAVRVKTRSALDAASDPATYCVSVFR